jgi:hydroxypyruvate reductase
VHAGIAAADAGRFVADALANGVDACRRSPRPVTLVAAGKAAAPMAAAFVRAHPGAVGAAMVASTHGAALLLPSIEWYGARHPIPDETSERAGRRALELAASATGGLIVLLSGGASSLLAVPRPGLTLEDKRGVTARLLVAGADIHALNAVRKHLSAIKGGFLAASARGSTLALAVSDVVDDDLSVIGSGPTVADPTTFSMALDVLDRFGGRSAYPRAAVRLLEAGQGGNLPETPKPADPRLASATTLVIGSRFDVLRAATDHASRTGYRATAIADPLVGEARHVAAAHVARMLDAAGGDTRACVLSTGETTVRVTGSGRGGRNQELALAAAPLLAACGRPAVFASVGTDGIDGPTDAAGAIVDVATVSRVQERHLSIDRVLDENDSYTLLGALGDLIVTGPTGTNVGDLQVLLVE